MATRIKMNHAEVGKMLRAEGRYRGIRAELTKRMERVLSAAQADPHDDTYDYEHGLHIEQVMTDRAVVRVVAGDWKGHILEANYGILARALDAAGMHPSEGTPSLEQLVSYTTLSGVTRKATRRQADAWMASRR